ncbi:MAG TPA: hypothetical protein DCL35_05275 [Candidatus Omnitrophica bacterium]|nr:hypothetical protein [Candidatus Omnitrophota bacterium]
MKTVDGAGRLKVEKTPEAAGEARAAVVWVGRLERLLMHAREKKCRKRRCRLGTYWNDAGKG